MKDAQKISWSTAFHLNCRALSLLYKAHPQMILSKLLSVIWNVLTPYGIIYLSARIIEALSTGKDEKILQGLVLITLASSALIALVSAWLTRWKNAQSAGLYFKCEQIFSRKLLDMDFDRIEDTKTHELLSLIHQNQNGGGWGLQQVILHCEELVSAAFTVLGGMALTITLFTSRVPETAGRYALLNHPLSTALVVLVMLLITCLAPVLTNKAGRYRTKYAQEHRLGNRLFSYFGFLGHNRELAADVRVYRQDLFCDKYNRNKESTFASKGIFAQYAKGPEGLLAAASSAVSVLFTGIAFLFVGLKAWAGAFGVGMVTQYVSSITKVSGGISKLISTIGNMKINAAFLTPVFAFLDIPNTMYQGSLTVEKRSDRNYEIEFRDVSFQYPGSNTFALRHVNMKFKIGERLAVVGMNGSGKTTFIKLLCRLYDPTEGVILLNGIDIRKYRYQDYLMIFSVVFQDFKLFALTLGENVASRSNYDAPLVVDCLRKAGFNARMDQMPDGIRTYLYKDYCAHGVNVSGGEAQKIAIARAIYKNAPFIILDEPTAALDSIAEAEIYSKFNEIVGDRTAIYISHRLSSCKFCDEIAVFDHGSVVQMGAHEDLVADTEGKYFELWNAQAQYYTT